jgi:hypothetical protein
MAETRGKTEDVFTLQLSYFAAEIMVYKPLMQEYTTKDGQCVKYTYTSPAACPAPAVWKYRATSQTDCLNNGTVCALRSGKKSYVNASQCTTCGGTPGSVYQWITPTWVNGTMLNTTFLPIKWQPRNQMKVGLNQGLLEALLQSVVGKVMGRKMVNDFFKQYGIFNSVYQYIACDCLDKNSTCFANTTISSVINSCIADPTSNSTCSGLQINSDTFNSTYAVSIGVNFVSGANFLPLGAGNTTVTTTTSAGYAATTATISRVLQKRQASIGISTQTSYLAYAVVKNAAGLVVGQIVADGTSISFDSLPFTSLTLCLPFDPSIPQNTTLFTVLDFCSTK